MARAPRLAIVGGNATRGLQLPPGEWETLDRHGEDAYALPHQIDHAANLGRLVASGCERVLAIASVGGLQPQYGPGTFLCPDDFISLAGNATMLSGRDAHLVIAFDPDWRGVVLEEWTSHADPPLLDGGVYWQSVGPRLESPAEVRHAARDADVIGMTIASECAAATELGLAYAAVCVVDNYANGVGESELTIEELEAGRAANREALAAALEIVLPALA